MLYSSVSGFGEDLSSYCPAQLCDRVGYGHVVQIIGPFRNNSTMTTDFPSFSFSFRLFDMTLTFVLLETKRTRMPRTVYSALRLPDLSASRFFILCVVAVTSHETTPGPHLRTVMLFRPPVPPHDANEDCSFLNTAPGSGFCRLLAQHGVLQGQGRRSVFSLLAGFNLLSWRSVVKL